MVSCLIVQLEPLIALLKHLNLYCTIYKLIFIINSNVSWLWLIHNMHEMWPYLWKGVFHAYPISWTCRTITLLSKDVWSWNFLQPLTYVGASCLPYFKSIAFTNLELKIVKVSSLDVCERPLFANPVTNYGGVPTPDGSGILKVKPSYQAMLPQS